jgi:lactoylglutathione lyase
MDDLKVPNVKQAVPFFMVTNLVASLDFYVAKLGFEMTNSWERNGKLNWCTLSIGEASLMLQEFLPENRTKEKLGEGMNVYFVCEDALAIYKHVISTGIKPTEPFVGNNMWVLGLTDPDGYKIFFESPTDVPEETTYTEWASEGLDD